MIRHLLACAVFAIAILGIATRPAPSDETTVSRTHEPLFHEPPEYWSIVADISSRIPSRDVLWWKISLSRGGATIIHSWVVDGAGESKQFKDQRTSFPVPEYDRLLKAVANEIETFQFAPAGGQPKGPANAAGIDVKIKLGTSIRAVSIGETGLTREQFAKSSAGMIVQALKLKKDISSLPEFE